jgi:hypothetical protein
VAGKIRFKRIPAGIQNSHCQITAGRIFFFGEIGRRQICRRPWLLIFSAMGGLAPSPDVATIHKARAAGMPPGLCPAAEIWD